MHLVLDTNILISSLIRKDTPPYLLYRAWRYQRFDLLTSAHQLVEVKVVLARHASAVEAVAEANHCWVVIS